MAEINIYKLDSEISMTDLDDKECNDIIGGLATANLATSEFGIANLATSDLGIANLGIANLAT
ncbi:hypothetical protein, partial [Nostoc sp. DedQUE07]